MDNKFVGQHTQFVNESDLDFKDISTESRREYYFRDQLVLKIPEPLYIHVSKSGGHRVFAANGLSYYISGGTWTHIIWRAKPQHANFVQ